ncbi:MAG: hypothetical protein ACTHNW_02785 [Mucilaginibacter sp.]
MKRVLITLSLLLFCLSAFCQGAKQIYENPNLKSIIGQQKTVAILPLRVTISFKKMPKNYDEANNAAQEKEEGLNMQQGMYTYLLRKADNYTVSFQDVERTNVLLKQAGIYEKVDQVTPDSLCKILKVDGVIKASYAYERTGSEAGAIIKTALFGYGGSTASGSLTMQVNNGSDGALIWRFYKEMNEGAFSSANELMERMMRKIARNFPYEK